MIRALVLLLPTPPPLSSLSSRASGLLSTLSNRSSPASAPLISSQENHSDDTAATSQQAETRWLPSARLALLEASWWVASPVLLYLTLFALTASQGASLLAALVYWHAMAEYTQSASPGGAFHALLLALSLYLSVRILKAHVRFVSLPFSEGALRPLLRQRRLTALLALLTGAALTHHPLCALLMVPLLCCALLYEYASVRLGPADRRALLTSQRRAASSASAAETPPRYVRILLCFAAGLLLPVLYFPLAQLLHTVRTAYSGYACGDLTSPAALLPHLWPAPDSLRLAASLRPAAWLEGADLLLGRLGSVATLCALLGAIGGLLASRCRPLLLVLLGALLLAVPAELGGAGIAGASAQSSLAAEHPPLTLLLGICLFAGLGAATLERWFYRVLAATPHGQAAVVPRTTRTTRSELDRLGQLVAREGQRRRARARRMVLTASVAASLAFGALLLLASGGSSPAVRDQDASALLSTYGTDLLAPLPADAVLLTYGEPAAGVAHLAYDVRRSGADRGLLVLDVSQMSVERYWLGVDLLSKPELVPQPARPLNFPGNHTNQYDAGSFTVADLIEANPERPFFLVTTRDPQPLAIGQAGELAFDPHDPLGLNRLRAFPHGLTWRVFPVDRSPPDLSPAEAARALRACTTLQQLPSSPAPHSWSRRVVEQYWEATHRVAFLYLRAGNHAEVVRLYGELRAHANGTAPPAEAKKWAINLAIALDTELQRASLGSVEYVGMLHALVGALDEYVSLARATDDSDVALATAEENLVRSRALLRTHTT